MCSIQYDVSHEWGCDFPNVFFTLPVGSSASVLFWPFYPITCVIMSYTKSPDHIISLLKPISLTCQKLKWRKKLPNAFECSLSISNITQCTQWHVITTPSPKKIPHKKPQEILVFSLLIWGIMTGLFTLRWEQMLPQRQPVVRVKKKKKG